MTAPNLRRAAAGAAGAAGYAVDYSCRFNDDDTAHLARTVSASPTDTDVLMLNCWAKLGAVAATEKDLLQTYDDANNRMGIGFNTADNYFVVQEKVGGLTKCDYTWPTILHRDPHAWYNVHVELNSSAGAGANVRVWINNVELAGETIGTEKTASEAWLVNTAGSLNFIGRGSNGNNNYMDGYIAQHIVVDGTVDGGPSNFIEVDDNGVVRPIDPVVADYGDDGHYLDFAIVESSGDGAGTDVSGKTNHWAASGIADNDRVTDTPTNNHCTWSPLWTGEASAATISDGNLKAAMAHNSAVFGSMIFDIADTDGWYFEVHYDSATSYGGVGVVALAALSGLADSSFASITSGATSNPGNGGYAFLPAGGQKRHGAGSDATYGGAPSVGSYIQCVMKAGSIYFGVDDSWANGSGANNQVWGSATAAFTSLTGLFSPAIDDDAGSGTKGTFTLRCSESDFEGTMPSGTKALNTTNLAVPSIADPSAHFQVNLREGDGAGATADVNGTTSSTTTLVVDGNSGTIAAGMYVTGTGVSGSVTVASLSDQNNLVLSSAQSLSDGVGLTFSSAVTQTGNSQFGTDLIIIKNRDATDQWNLVDRIRAATKELNPDANTAETTDANGVTAFSSSDGYTVGTGAGGYNDTGESFLDLHWKADGSTGASNTAGSINTTATAANDTAGFAYGKYTGTGVNATIGHGLSAAPDMIWVKNTTAATTDSWMVYHGGLPTDPETDYLVLDTDAIKVDDDTLWQDNAPSSTVFSIGTHVAVNTNLEVYMYYAWRSVAGYSSFGSYTGNASADGPLIITGFKPAVVVVKKTATATNNWGMYNTAVNPYIQVDPEYLYMDTTALGAVAGDGSQDFDILSNGFKVRNANGVANTAVVYAYMAWAESPSGGHGGTFGGGASPATAR